MLSKLLDKIKGSPTPHIKPDESYETMELRVAVGNRRKRTEYLKKQYMKTNAALVEWCVEKGKF